MAGRAGMLFERLQSREAILDLVGQAEDAHFDCKEWPVKDDDAQKMLAKAVCGLANADGGVIVIGMKAESRPKDEPDVVSGSAPVKDTSLVKSRVLNLISDLVEPGIVGLEAVEVADVEGNKSGFVVVYVPASDGPPRWSRKDSRFYQRIGSSTLPMSHRQIEAMFGVRPIPELRIHIEVGQMLQRFGLVNQPLRHITFGLTNQGRGMARFPGIRFKSTSNLRKDDFGIDGSAGFGLPWRPSDQAWITFRGGVDDVIYPGETRLIGKLIQTAINAGERGIGTPGQIIMGYNNAERTWRCEAFFLEVEISAESTITQSISYPLLEDQWIEIYRVNSPTAFNAKPKRFVAQ